MATQNVAVPEKTWTQITTASCAFQVIGQASVYVVESTTTPTDTSIIKVANPRRIYNFNRVDGNLYAYSPVGSASVSFDPTT